MINVKVEYNLTIVDVEFPCTEQILETKFKGLYRMECQDKDLLIIELKNPDFLQVLEKQKVDMDELNYLAKRLAGLDKKELNQFAAVVNQYLFINIKDLINLTFNLPRYTLISELGDMKKVGRTHIINLQGGLGVDEEECYDFAAIGKELINSGEGKITEYGILFENEEIPFDDIYDGQVFPEYVYEDCLVIVEMSYGGKSEYAYLPCEDMAIYKAQIRLNVCKADSCEMILMNYTIAHKEWIDKFIDILNTEGIYTLNHVAKAVESLDKREEMDAKEKLGPEMVGP